MFHPNKNSRVATFRTAPTITIKIAQPIPNAVLLSMDRKMSLALFEIFIGAPFGLN